MYLSNLILRTTRKDIIGAWIQFLAVIVAVVAGIVTTVQNYRNRTSV